ncbi:12239_t:CDS:2 [Funneliformis caledonium]|uniref:12239_t:CDS:1 n=1 Tax=Funneliformis caledonium TaxID=1117310 RepID=A0A9N9ESC9_9GLOM|nr:12239_t:CDS:2 [Funneliformis caledonium]
MQILDAGGVQVQHQPSNQDPTRQSWRNNSSNGDQGKRRDNSSNKSRPVNLKSINVERAQNMGATPIRTPKTAQFPRQSQQQQMYVMQPKSATFVKNEQRQQQQMRSSPQMSNMNNRTSPPHNIFISKSPPHTYNLSRSPPKTNNVGNVQNSSNPLNLSKSSPQVHNNLGRVPQTATFPPKVNRALNLPNPPKTATFAKSSSGFSKDVRQTIRPPQSATIPQQAYVYLGEQAAYLQAVEQQARFRRYSASPAPLRFVAANYRQVELNQGTPVVVLSHPDDSDSQGSSPPTPGPLPSDGYTGTDYYDYYPMTYEEEADESSYCYYYYDLPQEYIPPQTPTGVSHQQRSNTVPSIAKEERRRSVFGGPMKVHPDAVLPIRQPKGPDMAKNFATRIRRKAVNKLYAAAAERRSKSAADRRKSAMF